MIRNRGDLGGSSARAVALDCLEAGIAAALPERVVAETMQFDGETLSVGDGRYDLTTYDDVLVVGGGNAAGRFAGSLERMLGDRIDGGVVVTDEPGECDRIAQVVGTHPLPGPDNVEGTDRLRSVLEAAGERTLVLAVVTGGGSALLSAPADGIVLDDLRATTDALLTSGATIHEINAVRKHLSAVKGGGLARLAAPATVVTLVISDVVGDDLDVIASGPTVPDSSTYGDALEVVGEYDLSLPDAVSSRLERGAAGELPETPKPGDPAFESVHVHVLANGMRALAAAATSAREAGFERLVLSSRVRGEAREAAKTQVAIAEEMRATGHPVEPPAVVLTGGETTVTVRGDGTGGPNQEFVLSAAAELDLPGVVVAAVDTDGIDGGTDVAGALVDAETPIDASAARAALAANDAHPVLAQAGSVVETGRTGTNVNDLRVVVVDREDEIDT